MRKLLVLMLMTVAVLRAGAQQRPQYSQYVFNEFLVNPAVAGIENYTDVKAGYRSQWTGLQGAPITSYFSINAPLGSNFIDGDATRMPSGDDDAYGRSFTRTYRAAEPHHGIGLTMYTDKAGPIRQTNINASYAYHLGLSPTLNLAVGVSGGIANTTLNTTEITLDQANDQAINTANNSQIKPDVAVGIWAYSSDYFVGVSAQQILSKPISFNTNYIAPLQGNAVPHFYFTGGVKFMIADDVSLLPSVMVQFVKPAPATFDANLKMAFRDRFWIGGSYRQDDAVAAMFGFNFDSLFSIGYSYDYTTSNLNTVSNGTHEIVLGIYLNNKYRRNSPQHFW